jgi:6-phosphogluconolactonase (cycloisomerase 2 family)
MSADVRFARMLHDVSQRCLRGLAITLLLLSQATAVLAVLPPSAVWVPTEASDDVVTYTTAADGTLEESGRATAGTTPAAFKPHPNGLWGYGVNISSLNFSMYNIDTTTHALTELGRARACSDPNWIGVHPHGHTLYFTCHGFAKELPNVALEAVGWATINAFSGVPSVVNYIYAGGTAPGEGAIHPSGAFLVLPNRLSANLAVFYLDPNDGTPTLLTTVPTAAGPVSVAFDRSGGLLYAALYDARQLWAFRFDASTGTLTVGAKLSLAGYPTSVQVHSTGRFLYLARNSAADAMTGEAAIYALDTAGMPTWVNTVPTGGDSAEAIALERTGRFAYVAHHFAADGFHGGNVAMEAVDGATGELTPLGLGNISTGGFPMTILTSNPVADQARQDILARAASYAEVVVAPLFGTFGEDVSGAILGVSGYEVRWLFFLLTDNSLGLIVHATSTSDLLQRWTSVVDMATWTLTGWVPAP